MSNSKKQAQAPRSSSDNLDRSDSSFPVQEDDAVSSSKQQQQRIIHSVSFASHEDLCREYRVIPYWTIQDDDQLWYSAQEIQAMLAEHQTSLECLENLLRQQALEDDDDDDDDDDTNTNTQEPSSDRPSSAFQELYQANQHNSLPIDKALRGKIVNLYLESDEWVGLERVAAGLPSQQAVKIQHILQACNEHDSSTTNTTIPLPRQCQILSRGDRSFASNTGMAIAASIMMESVGERLAKAASMSLQKNTKTNHNNKTLASQQEPVDRQKNRISITSVQDQQDYVSDIDSGDDMDDVFDESDSDNDDNDDDDDDNNSVQSGKSLSSVKSALSGKSLVSTSSKYSMKDAIDQLLQQKQKDVSSRSRRASLTDAAPRRGGRFKLSMDHSHDHMPPSSEDQEPQLRGDAKQSMPRRASMESSGRAMMLMKASQQGRLDKDALKAMMMEPKITMESATAATQRKTIVSFAETLVTRDQLVSACADEPDDAVIWYTKAELQSLARDFLHAPQTLAEAGAIGKGTASTLSKVFELSEEEKALPEKLQSKLLGYYVEYTDIVGLEYIIMGQRYVQARRLKEIMEAIHRIRESVNGPLQHRAIVAASRKITKQARDFAVRMGMGQAAAATVINAAGGADVPKRELRRSKGSSRSLGSSKSFRSIKSHKSSKSSKSSKSMSLERSNSSKKLERSSSKKKLERSESKRLERKASSKKRLSRSSSRDEDEKDGEKVRSPSVSSHKSRKSRSKSHDDGDEGRKKRSSSVKSRKLEKSGSKKKLEKSSSKKKLDKDSKEASGGEHTRRKLTKRTQEAS